MRNADVWLGPSFREWPKTRYRMATTAIHKLGDISRDEPDLCLINGETDTDYIGSWETGIGFIYVKFPKDTTRKLTREEAERFTGMCVVMGSLPAYPIVIDTDEIEP